MSLSGVLLACRLLNLADLNFVLCSSLIEKKGSLCCEGRMESCVLFFIPPKQLQAVMLPVVDAGKLDVNFKLAMNTFAYV